MIDAQTYERQGFLIVRDVFPAEECVRFKSELLREIAKGQQELEREEQTGVGGPIDREVVADVPRAVNKGMLQDTAHRSPFFMAIAKDPRLIGCVTPMLGDNLALYRSLSVFKNDRTAMPVGWHQDMTYWRGGSRKISAWVSLDDVDEATGAMRLIPGSHRSLIDDLEHQDEVFSLVIPDGRIDSAQQVVAETRTGDVVLFDACVIHGSGANRTGRDRYALVYTYQPAGDGSHHRAGAPALVAGVL